MDKWYKKPLVIILFIIFLFPIGLFLMWRYTNWHRRLKIIVSVLAIFLSGYALGSVNTASTPTAVSEQVASIEVDNKAEQEEKEEAKEKEEKEAELKAEQEAHAEQKAKEEADRQAAEAKTKADQEAAAAAEQQRAQEQAAAVQAAAEQQRAQEQAAAAQQQQQQSSQNEAFVYFTPNGKSYHSRTTCPTLNHSSEILSGTLQEAINTGHADVCDVCW